MIHRSFYSQYLNMGVYVDIESTTIEIYVLQKAEKQLKTHQLFIQDKFNLHVFIRIRTRDLVQKLSKYLKFLTSAYT